MKIKGNNGKNEPADVQDTPMAVLQETMTGLHGIGLISDEQLERVVAAAALDKERKRGKNVRGK